MGAAAKASKSAPVASQNVDAKKQGVITMAELMQHNRANDCWIAVRGKVYDVTGWVPKHPGGEDPLVLNGGRDATQLFEAYHPVRVFGSLSKYYVGDLERSEYPTFPPMSDFYVSLKKKVEAYFTERKMSPRYAPEMLVRSALIVLGVFAAHYASLVTNSLAASVLFAALAGLGGAWVCFMPTHEGSHASTTESPLLWRVQGMSLDYVLGAGYFTWLHQHFLGHHPFTNVVDHERPIDAIDPDILTNEPDLRRIKPHQPYHSHYRFQKFYAPLLYGLLGMKFRVNDFIILFGVKSNGIVRVNPMNTWHTVNFWLGKAFWFTYRLVLPCFFVPVWHVLLLFVVSDLVSSYTLALVFQVNHVIPQVKWPAVDKNTGMVNMDWAQMQLATTLDYAHGSWWTTFATGALNYQVTHHLFPYISQIHYPQIAPIIKQHCKEHGVTYHELPSFWAALKNHVNYLAMLGAQGKVHVH
eukprot:TRINITY_DN918_c0_g1_i1.p1 TRINITY_DN918_c0_g1~~TRINITY_DN918_c0_g1_i1.p1  ORF type:complete len:505 (+),score=158.16 TRINITY_DN918_c0_g1_i1:111-1517(+)